MAYFKDWTGFMATVEEVEPDPDTEKKALRNLINISDDPEEIADVARILGIDHHLPAIREEARQI